MGDLSEYIKERKDRDPEFPEGFDEGYERLKITHIEQNPQDRSPFDVPGISTNATTEDIVDAVRESRRRELLKDIEESEKEFREGKLEASSPDAIIKRILS